MTKSAEPVVFLRGEMIPASEANIAIFDLAVVLGATVTDMTRTIGHKPFRLDDHVGRFYRSCKYARIPPPFSAAETTEKTLELIDHNTALIEPDQDLGVIYFMSPGLSHTYSGSPEKMGEIQPTFCIHSFGLPFQAWAEHYKSGVHVVTPSVRHVPPQCLDPKIKNRSRLHWWVAEQEVKLVDTAAATLLLDLDGNVTECSGSNFLIVKDGKIILPSPRNVLRGISMVTVTDLAEELGIPLEERDFQIYDVINAEEAMLSSTPYCLAPATRINGITIGSGKPGPIFHRLMETWSKRVGKDLIKQVTTVRFPA